jgi:hypothetical protein
VSKCQHKFLPYPEYPEIRYNFQINLLNTAKRVTNVITLEGHFRDN